jgi:hypothetical protein
MEDGYETRPCGCSCAVLKRQNKSINRERGKRDTLGMSFDGQQEIGKLGSWEQVEKGGELRRSSSFILLTTHIFTLNK